MPGFELIGKEEQEAVSQIFEDGGILFAHGFDAMRKNFHVREFEVMAINHFKCNHALAVSSGTAAIKIGLKSFKTTNLEYNKDDFFETSFSLLYNIPN